MAMFIGAQPNGFGMVGFWPTARIVSVRANIAGQDRFTPSDFTDGVKLCSDVATLLGVKVIALPMSSELPLTAGDASDLKEELSAAHDLGINVVAAAGNTDGRSVGAPANFPGVIAVGGTHTGSGALCGFSATGASVLTPGCALDGADPSTGAPSLVQQGTSEASVILAAALAALRTWRPDVSADSAVRLLTEHATRTIDGLNLNLAAAFRAAGLASIVGAPIGNASPTPEPSPAPSPTATPTPSAPPLKVHLPKPKLTVRTHGVGRKRILVVKAANRPPKTRLSVSVYARTPKGKLRLSVKRVRDVSDSRDPSTIMATHQGSLRGSNRAATRQRRNRVEQPQMKTLCCIAVGVLALVAGVSNASATVFEVRSCAAGTPGAYGWSDSASATFTSGLQCPAIPGQLASGIFAVPRSRHPDP